MKPLYVLSILVIATLLISACATSRSSRTGSNGDSCSHPST
jgi:hypothetical protein